MWSVWRYWEGPVGSDPTRELKGHGSLHRGPDCPDSHEREEGRNLPWIWLAERISRFSSSSQIAQHCMHIRQCFSPFNLQICLLLITQPIYGQHLHFCHLRVMTLKQKLLQCFSFKLLSHANLLYLVMSFMGIQTLFFVTQTFLCTHVVIILVSLVNMIKEGCEN